MFEVGVGFTLRHVSPAAFAKESLHEAVDVGGSDVLGDIAEFIETFMVMGLDGGCAALEVSEGVSMRGEGELDAADFTDPVKRIEK